MSDPNERPPDTRPRLRAVEGGRSQDAPAPHPVSFHRPSRRTIAILSGKGGVGKTNLAANLAIALARRGRRILLVDGDLSLANVDLLMGVIPRFTMEHVLSGEKTLEEIVVESYAGIRLIPAASGVQELANLDDFRRECLFRSLSRLDENVDLILIDAGSGIARNVTSLALAADDALIVTTPEPTAFSDAYAAVKVLAASGAARPPKIVVNMARSAEEAREIHARIRKVSEQFLDLSPEDWGFVYEDPAVAKAVRNQEPFLLSAPQSPAARSIDQLARRVLENGPEPHEGMTGWFRRLGEVKAG